MTDTRIDYEVRVDGCCEAASSDLGEARRYFEQYKHDGECVELLKVETLLTQENPGFDWVKRAATGG